MIGEKVQHFQNKHTDLDALRGRIESYLKSEGFDVQSSSPSPHGTLLQARKGGFMAKVITADRALNILIDGRPDDFTVRLGIGKWAEHLGVMALETMLLSGLFLFIDVPEMLWTTEIENQLAAQIASFVG
ncbi:MAG TPA: hypothetical protein VJ992_10950 [Gemmatimonadales bacterium]|nr:hypothetical protein [Gemmatimonadales bacterium]